MPLETAPIVATAAPVTAPEGTAPPAGATETPPAGSDGTQAAPDTAKPAEGSLEAGAGKPKGKEDPKGAKKPEEDKTPATDRESAYGRAVRAREVKLVEREQRFAGERANVERAAAETKAQAEKLSAREAAITAREKELDEDPLAYAVKHKGYRDEDLARRFLGDGKPSAQELARRKDEQGAGEVGELKAALAALQAKVDAKENAEKQAIEQAEAAKRNDSIRAQFADHAGKQATAYPLAAAAIAKLGKDAVDECNVIGSALRAEGEKRQGGEYWNLVLARYNDRLTKLTGAVAPSTKEPESPGLQGKKPEEKAPTLSNKQASQRGSKVDLKDDPLLYDIDPEAGRKKVLEVAKAAREAHAASRKTAAT